MTGLQAVLLGAAVTIQVVCCLGVLLLEDATDRLHLVGPVSVLATLAVVVAVAAGAASRTHLAKVAVTGLVVAAASPFVSRATARALRVRERGGMGVEAVEVESDGSPPS